MSLFGSMMADVEDDPYFGSHIRQMRQMNNMMNSLFADPFGMFGGMGGGNMLAIGGPRHGNALMPFMPQMPTMNRLYGDINGHMGAGSSYSSSTVVMSSGLNGRPQVYSSSSSTKIGPDGVKETRKTLEDSRTGTKKMSIGHHIGERAHVVEREQNVYSGDREERQEFINLEEEEAEDFDREFQHKVGSYNPSRVPQLTHGPAQPARLALPPPPAVSPNTQHNVTSGRSSRVGGRRPLRVSASPLTTTSRADVRSIYSGSQPQRHKHKRSSRHSMPHDQ